MEIHNVSQSSLYLQCYVTLAIWMQIFRKYHSWELIKVDKLVLALVRMYYELILTTNTQRQVDQGRGWNLTWPKRQPELMLSKFHDCREKGYKLAQVLVFIKMYFILKWVYKSRNHIQKYRLLRHVGKIAPSWTWVRTGPACLRAAGGQSPARAHCQPSLICKQ